MIQLPRRSVTRFFIPLIDVLTLLFCIYLLMPIVEPAKGSGEADPSMPLTQLERAELEGLRKQLAALRSGADFIEAERQELERLRREKIEVLQQRLAIRVLEIDADTGKLFYYDRDPIEIKTEAEAHELIRRQKQEAGGREIYYLFLFPRKVTGFPQERQIRLYERWFAGVAHGVDNPRAGRR
jgi:hypothetical protein